MTKNAHSPLAVLRLVKQNEDSICLEIYDPEKNSAHKIAFSDSSKPESINDALNSIKNNISNDYKTQELYAHWIERGWAKSLDYYVASRDFLGENVINLFSEYNKLPIDRITNNVKKKDSILRALLNRRSKRVFQNITIENHIFHSGAENAAQYILNSLDGLKVYFIVYNIDNILPGVYSYDAKANSLSLIHDGIFSDDMSAIIQGMNTPKTANFSIILVAHFDALMKLMPYPKGLRDVYIESGRLAQKLIISYAQYGIFCLVTPALCDSRISNLLKIKEPEFAPLYSLTFGYPLK
jgi:hypothetical protein